MLLASLAAALTFLIKVVAVNTALIFLKFFWKSVLHHFLLAIKKVAGSNLNGNIWGLYFLIRSHNYYVEGTSDIFMATIFRVFPQDLLVIVILLVIVRGSALISYRNVAVER